MGNICMDQCMADVTGLDVKPGDVVTLIGEDGRKRVTVDAITRCSESINNETFCRLTKRVPRFFTGTGDPDAVRKQEDGRKRVTVDAITRCSESINNETFCRLTKRVPRFFTGTGDPDAVRKQAADQEDADGGH